MECSDRATPVFFLKQGEVCVSLRVFGRLHAACLCQSQHGEAPMQETDVGGKKDRAGKFTRGAGIHTLTPIEGYHRLRHS